MIIVAQLVLSSSLFACVALSDRLHYVGYRSNELESQDTCRTMHGSFDLADHLEVCV